MQKQPEELIVAMNRVAVQAVPQAKAAADQSRQEHELAGRQGDSCRYRALHRAEN